MHLVHGMCGVWEVAFSVSDVYGMEQVGVVKHKMLCAACRRWHAACLTSMGWNKWES